MLCERTCSCDLPAPRRTSIASNSIYYRLRRQRRRLLTKADRCVTVLSVLLHQYVRLPVWSVSMPLRLERPLTDGRTDRQTQRRTWVGIISRRNARTKLAVLGLSMTVRSSCCHCPRCRHPGTDSSASHRQTSQINCSYCQYSNISPINNSRTSLNDRWVDMQLCTYALHRLQPSWTEFNIVEDF